MLDLSRHSQSSFRESVSDLLENSSAKLMLNLEVHCRALILRDPSPLLVASWMALIWTFRVSEVSNNPLVYCTLSSFILLQLQEKFLFFLFLNLDLQVSLDWALFEWESYAWVRNLKYVSLLIVFFSLKLKEENDRLFIIRSIEIHKASYFNFLLLVNPRVAYSLKFLV